MEPISDNMAQALQRIADIQTRLDSLMPGEEAKEATPPASFASYLPEPATSGSIRRNQGMGDTAYAPIVARAAQQYGIRPALLNALIKLESGFNPDAISSKGAQGLMQLMPETAQSLGVNDHFDPEQNIAGGARYLRQQLDRFDGDERLALAAYNAGPGAVLRYNGIPPYPETQRYVENVLAASNE